MIAFLFAAAMVQATPIDGTGLGAIGRQSLPATGCAAYLWSVADRQLVAMAVAAPAMVRLSIDGKTVDFSRTSQQGTTSLGFGTTTGYGAGDVSVRLDMTIVPRENLVAGAQVPAGSLQIDRKGRDTVVVPVAGLVGCAS